MPSKIYFKGAGLVTSIGSSVEQALASVEQNDYQPPSKIGVEQANQVIEIPYFTINKPGPAVGVDRIYQIIDSVVQQAIDDSGLSMAQISEMGLFVGSTSFDMPKCEMALKASDCTDEDLAIHVPPFNRLTSYIQSRFSINGPVFTFNTACTSSANALIYAAEFIRRGDIDRALVLGLEFYNEVTALGFVGLELISKLGMRPFDNNRDGLYLGEGCGALIISAEAGNDDFAYVAGANLGDNFSITACNPEGAAVHTVIDNALSQAGISTSDIALIKTHGTASLSNDEAEAAGLVTVFDGHIPPIVALKPLIGHTLGACGIIELILFYQALQRKIPVSFPCQVSDKYPLRLADSSDIPDKGNYLLNYFGFGGNCTSLVISNA